MKFGVVVRPSILWHTKGPHPTYLKLVWGLWIMCGGTSKSSNVSIFGMWNPCLEVYTTSWWMGLFKSLTPKRHIGWSNSWAISLIDGGRLSRARAKQYGLHLAKSAISYEKGGKKKYQGTSLLKSTGYRPQYRLVYFQAVATYFGF